MPKGVPKAGFRKTHAWAARNNVNSYASQPNAAPSSEGVADHVIEARIAERFSVLHHLTDSVITGDTRALIVSGPPGVGKTHTIETKLEAAGLNEYNYRVNKGNAKATGLFKLFWEYKEKGQILVFDDIDSVFNDETSLNLLKAALDTTTKRHLSWLSESILLDESQKPIPRNFVYEGSAIFATNYDFDYLIEKGTKLSPHLQALMSRSQYINLGMTSRRARFIRIRQSITNEGLLTSSGLNEAEQAEIILFIETHLDQLREISLRTALKIASIRRQAPDKWEALSRIMNCNQN